MTTDKEDAILNAAKLIMGKRLKAMQNPLDAEEISNTRMTRVFINDYLHLHYADRTQEVFGVIPMSTRNIPLGVVELTVGGVSHGVVEPSAVLRTMLDYPIATGCILFHNHPSGAQTPSAADRQITASVKKLMKQLGFRLLDHIIVAGEENVSMAELGLT